MLIYGTGGLAYGNADYAAESNFVVNREPAFLVSFDDTKVGWTGGGGVEVAIARHWTIKVEYLYFDLGEESTTSALDPVNHFNSVHYRWDTDAHTVKAGLNFKF